MLYDVISYGHVCDVVQYLCNLLRDFWVCHISLLNTGTKEGKPYNVVSRTLYKLRPIHHIVPSNLSDLWLIQ